MSGIIFSFLAVIFFSPDVSQHFLGAQEAVREKAQLPASQAAVLGETDQRNDASAGPSQEVLSGEAEKRDYAVLDLFATGVIPTRKKDSADLKLWSGASVSIDADSGTILHYENGRKRTQIASLTKMMTAVLVVEKVKNLNEEVVITREALNVPGTVVGCPTSVLCNANRMYVGEKLTVLDLLKAMLLNSANDAATALAIHVSGSMEKFVEEMNARAREIGLIDTSFCTPSGLEIDDKPDDCYSSAYDIARIGAFSLRYGLIWEIMQLKEAKIYSTDGRYMHQLKNTDLLLGDIPNCLGGKTGFTPLAGKSLLMGSTDATGKHKIISVLLNDENRWEDMRVLVNWIANNYEWK